MALLLIYLIIIVALQRSCVSTSNDQQPKIVKARLGENVTLICAPEVNRTLIFVEWNKLYPDETTESKMSTNGGHLVFENLQIVDAGLYKCHAIFGEERVDPVVLQTFKLEVEVSTCTYHESNYSNLTSNCSSNGMVHCNTKCSFECDNSSILLGHPLLTCGTNNTFDYPLPKCRGKNVYAVVNPRIADVGENVVMLCPSDLGEDEYNLYWYKLKPIKTLLLSKTSAGVQTTFIDRGYQTKNGTDLLIPSATKDDSGIYQCNVFSHGNYFQSPYNSSLVVKETCTMPALVGALHTNTTTCRSEATIVEGTSCHYYCQSNYKLVGQGSTKCLENGSLSEHVPSCRPKDNLKEGQTRNKWWIAVIIVAAMAFGAIGVFGIWKLRKRERGEYRDVSTVSGVSGDTGLSLRAQDLP